MTQAATLAQLASSGALSADTSGNVGIGTTTPITKLTISGSSSIVGELGTLAITGNTNAKRLTFGVDSTSTMYGWIQSVENGIISRDLVLQSLGGNLLVGTTSTVQSGTFSVLSTTSTAGFRTTATAGSGIVLEVSRTSATGDMVYFRTSSTTLAGYITCPTGTTTSYASVSDYRLKENVLPMVGALAKVAQLKPCTYTWKHDGSDGQGFIAHELQAIVPDCVTGEKDAVNEDGSIKPQGIDTSFLVATLTAALQELKAELDVCKAEIAALKGV
jgi:hypothetical protein